MAKVFLSHSSNDKDFVRRLANDLLALGHEPWLDEWDIQVGQHIITQIQAGLTEADFLVVVLSPDAVESGWVDREWKNAYWREVSDNRVVVLPVMYQRCRVPALLAEKKYANLADDYQTGLNDLALALGGVSPKEALAKSKKALTATRLTHLIRQVQDDKIRLSSTIADVMLEARNLGATDLYEFCAHEIGGWPETDLSSSDPKYPAHRTYTLYLSAGEMNMLYFGWNGHAGNMISYFEQNPKEHPKKMLIDGRPLVQIEAAAYDGRDPARTILHFTRTLGSINSNATTPNAIVHCYARADVYQDLITRTRADLATRLMSLCRVYM